MKKVITYGTFDLFHRGHYNILKRAKECGDYLIVGVTSESYDIERGKLNVHNSLLERIENVRKTGFADEIIVEEYQGQKVSDIIKYNIDTLVVGSDWYGKFDYLKNYCEVLYLERTKDISSTQIRNETNKIYCIGIVTDELEDDSIVEESKYVSGIHVKDVFAEGLELAADFAQKYELDSSYCDWNEFLSRNDIIYVKCAEKKRAEYCRKALASGKYVMCEAPITHDPQQMKELFNLAMEKKVFLIEKIPMVYLRAFNQLVWLLRGGLVGDIVNIQCSISGQSWNSSKSLYDLLIYPICATLKLLGRKYTGLTNNFVKDGEDILYDVITINYGNTLAVLEASRDIQIEDRMNIIGRKGRVMLDGQWWNTGYFEAKLQGQEGAKHYSFNFEGNGVRYLLHEMLIMINDQRLECTRLFHDESMEMLKILKQIDQNQ